MAVEPTPGAEGRRRLGRRVWVGTAVLAGLVVVLFLIGGMHKTPPPKVAPRVLANVETLVIAPRQYREALILPARVEAGRRATLSSELAARLDRWLVAEGASVTEGQPLAHLDTLALEARLAELNAQRAAAEATVTVAERQLASARIALTGAEADRELRKRELERLTRLHEQEIVAQSELDSSQNVSVQAGLHAENATEAVAQGEAGLALAKAHAVEIDKSLASLQVAVDKSTIRAPFAGRVDKQLAEAGEVVAPGTPLIRLLDLSSLRAVVDVADRYVPFLDTANPAIKDYLVRAMPGAEQDVRALLVMSGPPKLTGGTYAGLELPGAIERIGQAADRASNTFEVELRFPNPGVALKEGMIAEAHIEYLLFREAIVIPLSAVQVADVGPRVLVVEKQDGKDKAFVRNIEPVSISGRLVLVSRGLKPGERLIVSGGKGVINGEEVNVLVADGELHMDDLPAGAPKPIRVAPDYAPAPQGEVRP